MEKFILAFIFTEFTAIVIMNILANKRQEDHHNFIDKQTVKDETITYIFRRLHDLERLLKKSKDMELKE